MTIAEAAAALGVTRQTVLNRALAGDLQTTMLAGRHFVRRASLAAYLAAHPLETTPLATTA